MINRPSAFDITNNPISAWNKFSNEINAVSNDLYILTVGARSTMGEMPNDIKNQLRGLAQSIYRMIEG